MSPIRAAVPYEKANKTNTSVTVIICYTAADLLKTTKVMRALGLNKADAKKVVVIDASPKQSASKV